MQFCFDSLSHPEIGWRNAMVFAENGRKIKLVLIAEERSDLLNGTFPTAEHFFCCHHPAFCHVCQRSAAAMLQKHPVDRGAAQSACFGQIRDGIHLVQVEMNNM